MSLSLSNFGPLSMVNLPGGWFVMGSSHYEDAQPHWAFVPPFSITPAPVTEEEFCSIRGTSPEASSFVDEIGDVYQKLHPSRPLSSTQYPITYVSWQDQGRFNDLMSQAFGRPLSRPREAQHEYATRGRVVNIRERMEAEGVKLKDFVEWAKDRFENFVTHIEQGADILYQPDDERLKKILQSKAALWAWQVYGTVNGRLFEKKTDGTILKNAWCDEYGRRKANGTRKIVLPWAGLESHWEQEGFLNDQIEAGFLHSHGMVDGTGNVWNWCEENYQKDRSWKVLRGGSWTLGSPYYLRLACRNSGDPDYRGNIVGFRCVAAPQDSRAK